MGRIKIGYLFGIILLIHSVSAGQNLPLPRFVSLRSNEVNLRVGPGAEYPIEWIFRLEKMPVEILQEFESWRKIRDFEGAEGWVHQSMLSGKRMVLILKDQVLRKKPDPQACGLVQLGNGVIGNILGCKKEWCRLQVEGYKGWILRSALWGIYPHEYKD